MKYALFALGLLLLLAGGISIITGAGIIDAERGWSSVIAGTTAFVGGVLTLSLAWIIKALEDLRAAIADSEPSVAARGVAPQMYVREEPAKAPIASVAWPPHTTPAPISTDSAESFETSSYDTELALHETDLGDALPNRSVTAHNEAADAAMREPVTGSMAAKPSTSVKDLWRRVAKEIDTTNPIKRFGSSPRFNPEHDTTPPTPPIPPAKPSVSEEEDVTAHPVAEAGDWLDHALADFDTSLPQRSGPAREPATSACEHRETIENAPLEEVHGLQTAEHDQDFAAAVEEAAPPLAPEPAQDHVAEAVSETPAIIGRYEAEGTSYIMFADGSIEAQSERGIARFRSMADLKAYFESQEAG